MLEVKPQPTAIPEAGLTIAEAARRAGVSAHTLRYYERAGLVVTSVDRTTGGRRRYHQLDLDWIRVCTKLRATGMPIKNIRRYAQLVAAGYGNEQERLALLEERRSGRQARRGPGEPQAHRPQDRRLPRQARCRRRRPTLGAQA